MLESIQNVIFGKPDSMLIKDGLRAGMGKGGQEAGWWQEQIFGVVNEAADVNQGPHSHDSACLETLLCG